MQDTACVDIGLQLAQNAGALRLSQAGGIQDIKGQLDLRGGAINMLSPWATTATKLKVQFGEWDCHYLGNLEVSVWWHDSAPLSTPRLARYTTPETKRLCSA